MRCHIAFRHPSRLHPATLSSSSGSGRRSRSTNRHGTLAMLAQWIAIASQESFRKARTEPFITLGSAPLFDPGFRSVILGQLGESRLVAAIDADIAGEQAYAKELEADTKGPLATFTGAWGRPSSSNPPAARRTKVAHLPELRFALGEPEVDTTSVDNAALALEDRSYFVRKAAEGAV